MSQYPPQWRTLYKSSGGDRKEVHYLMALVTSCNTILRSLVTMSDGTVSDTLLTLPDEQALTDPFTKSPWSLLRKESFNMREDHETFVMNTSHGLVFRLLVSRNGNLVSDSLVYSPGDTWDTGKDRIRKRGFSSAMR